MRLIITAVMASAVALTACGAEQAGNETSEQAIASVAPAVANNSTQGELTTNADGDIVLPDGSVVHSEPEGPMVQPATELGDIPPCISIYEGATVVRSVKSENKYGRRIDLIYRVNAPQTEVIDFVKRTVAENGCRLDHTQSIKRLGVELYTLWSSESVQLGRSATLEINGGNNPNGPTGVAVQGHWIEP